MEASQHGGREVLSGLGPAGLPSAPLRSPAEDCVSEALGGGRGGRGQQPRGRKPCPSCMGQARPAAHLCRWPHGDRSLPQGPGRSAPGSPAPDPWENLRGRASAGPPGTSEEGGACLPGLPPALPLPPPAPNIRAGVTEQTFCRRLCMGSGVPTCWLPWFPPGTGLFGEKPGQHPHPRALLLWGWRQAAGQGAPPSVGTWQPRPVPAGGAVLAQRLSTRLREGRWAGCWVPPGHRALASELAPPTPPRKSWVLSLDEPPTEEDHPTEDRRTPSRSDPRGQSSSPGSSNPVPGPLAQASSSGAPTRRAPGPSPQAARREADGGWRGWEMPPHGDAAGSEPQAEPLAMQTTFSP